VELGALKVGHPEFQVTHQVIIHQADSWGWKVLGGENGKWPSFTRDHEFTFAVNSIVAKRHVLRWGSWHFPQVWFGLGQREV
jgi:hypothetical protein